MRAAADIAELRRRARAATPRMFNDYLEAGSWTQWTRDENRRAFERRCLRQRVLVGVASRSTASTLLGRDVALPLALAPVGLAGMHWPDGEIAAARAAEAAGVPFTLSTMSVCSIEEVAAATTKPFWFQLYMMRDRDFVARLLARARKAKCSALVLTVDLPVLGLRHCDARNGLSVPPKFGLRALLQLAARPAWCWRMLGARRRDFGNLVGHIDGVGDLSSLSHWTAEQFDPGLNWDDLGFVREHWDGPLVVKGVLDPVDAQRAAGLGAAAIVVSNHGGRQLDGAMASLDALPGIVAALAGSDCAVWLDGGVRSGQDLIKALALGARGVLAGRAWCYGLAAGGQAGVANAIEIIRREMDLSMALGGLRSVDEIDRAAVVAPAASAL